MTNKGSMEGTVLTNENERWMKTWDQCGENFITGIFKARSSRCRFTLASAINAYRF
jgi:hypothetical protein